MKPLPPPFDQIKHGNTGTILGKEISTNGSTSKAVAERITKAQNTLGIVNYRIPHIEVINTRIEIMIWNSLIRSTIIYGPRAKDLPRNLIGRIETYMYKHIRATMRPR